MQDFVIWWNNNFPLDYWYRKYHNIEFGSKQHRSLEPFSILFAWQEEQMQTIIHNQSVQAKWKKDYETQQTTWLKTKENPSFYENLGEDFFKQFDD